MQRPYILLYPNEDRDKNVYYIGRMKSPITMNFKDGMAFLLFIDDQPELHFCPLDSPDISNVFEYYTEKRNTNPRAKHGNLCVELYERQEKLTEEDITLGIKPRNFYIGKLKMNSDLNCKDGVVFLCFVSEKGFEELQIAAMKTQV